MGLFSIPEIDMPHIVEAELVTIMSSGMDTHPRGLKLGPGPSDAGHPCTRYLIHAIHNQPKPPGKGDRYRWAARIGTFGHAGLESDFITYNNAMVAAGEQQARYLLEQTVTCGTYDGIDLIGSADVFDIDSGTVVDWKFVGPTPLLGYKANGPGPKYRTQAHLYGRGFQLQGFRVNQVMIAFLPRGGELGTPELKVLDGQVLWADRGQRYFWSEPYDEQVALDALARLNGLSQLLKLVGLEQLLASFGPCVDFFCPWCNPAYKRVT